MPWLEFHGIINGSQTDAKTFPPRRVMK